MANSKSAKSEQGDTRGVKLGTGVAYDDIYAGSGENAEYVSELPTPDEEKRMHAEGVRAKEDEEELDEGRESNHPSTLASRIGKVSLKTFLSSLAETLERSFLFHPFFKRVVSRAMMMVRMKIRLQMLLVVQA